MDTYAVLKDLTARVEALEQDMLASVLVPDEDAAEDRLLELAEDYEAEMVEAVDPMPYETEAERAEVEAALDEEIDEAVAESVEPMPYEGTIEDEEWDALDEDEYEYEDLTGDVDEDGAVIVDEEYSTYEE